MLVSMRDDEREQGMALRYLTERVAVVTGAARGIGAATASRLAADGATVAVLDLDAHEAESHAQTLRASGTHAISVACDVADPASVSGAFTRVAEELGAVDILVNNAGVLRDNLVFRMTDSDWETVMSVHLRGAFQCSRAAQALMVPRRWGKIVNLSSVSALGNRGQVNYSAAKAGLQGFTRALSIELGPFNINVNAVAPGLIETDMTHATAQRIGTDFETMAESNVPTIPMRRVGRPDDIAGVIAFLCSEDASYVTGQTIYVTVGPQG